MLGSQSFEAAQSTLAGIELMHMIRKSQLEGDAGEGLTAAEQFYALTEESHSVSEQCASPQRHARICDRTIIFPGCNGFC